MRRISVLLRTKKLAIIREDISVEERPHAWRLEQEILNTSLARCSSNVSALYSRLLLFSGVQQKLGSLLPDDEYSAYRSCQLNSTHSEAYLNRL